MRILVILGLFALASRGEDVVPYPRKGPENVLVLVNTNSSMSRHIADYYIKARNIPESHKLELECPESENITEADYNTLIYGPLRDFILDNNLKDSISFIVLTKGLPIRIRYSEDNRSLCSMIASLLWRPSLNRTLSPYFNRSSMGTYRIQPFFPQSQDIYLVTALDGYQLDGDGDSIPDDVKQLMDNSLAAEPGGLFVLDIDPSKGGGYEVGNDWIRAAYQILTDWGILDTLDTTATFLVGLEDVGGYCSWGSNDSHDTTHGEPFFSWHPGALSTTYVSTSARSFSHPPSYGQSLIADEIHEGVTGTVGFCNEPYLDACGRPQLLFPAYIKGLTLGEAFYQSLRYLNWMNIVCGDPLCAPYAKKMETPKGLIASFEGSKVRIDWNSLPNPNWMATVIYADIKTPITPDEAHHIAITRDNHYLDEEFPERGDTVYYAVAYMDSAANIGNLSEEVKAIKGGIVLASKRETSQLLCKVVPNPFKSVGEIRLFIPSSTDNSIIKVFEPTGRLVREFEIEPKVGLHTIRWDGSQLPAGVYILQVSIGKQRITEKVIILHR